MIQATVCSTSCYARLRWGVTWRDIPAYGFTDENRFRGVPHSLQGLKGGVEFLLVFDDGSFSEDNTFLASEVFAHNPV